MLIINDKGIGIDQNLFQFGVKVRFSIEQQEARLCRDSDFDFIGDLKIIAADKLLFIDENLDMAFEL